MDTKPKSLDVERSFRVRGSVPSKNDTANQPAHTCTYTHTWEPGCCLPGIRAVDVDLTVTVARVLRSYHDGVVLCVVSLKTSPGALFAYPDKVQAVLDLTFRFFGFDDKLYAR